jgi:hypothetical protein
MSNSNASRKRACLILQGSNTLIQRRVPRPDPLHRIPLNLTPSPALGRIGIYTSQEALSRGKIWINPPDAATRVIACYSEFSHHGSQNH